MKRAAFGRDTTGESSASLGYRHHGEVIAHRPSSRSNTRLVLDPNRYAICWEGPVAVGAVGVGSPPLHAATDQQRACGAEPAAGRRRRGGGCPGGGPWPAGGGARGRAAAAVTRVARRMRQGRRPAGAQPGDNGPRRRMSGAGSDDRLAPPAEIDERLRGTTSRKGLGGDRARAPSTCGDSVRRRRSGCAARRQTPQLAHDRTPGHRWDRAAEPWSRTRQQAGRTLVGQSCGNSSSDSR